LSLDAEAELRIASYLEELGRWGKRMNLVGSCEPTALREHVEDSLAAVPHLPDPARVVDLGSGAGFPGIPLAIARPDLSLDLVEIREKRVSFLRHVVRTLGLGCRVLRARIEDPPPHPYDRVLLRAVAPPKQALELARPWARDDGEVWIWAGPAAEIPEATLTGKIPLGPRGAILRATLAHVSRGTPR
jgi:16S rRNA (guanine527-N7)-methyltransferase